MLLSRHLCLPMRCRVCVPHVRRHERQRSATAAAMASAPSAPLHPPSPSAAGAGGATDDPLVQWVVLRRDLWSGLGWPLGPVIAQACHASTAALLTHLADADTQQYTAAANIDHMHKVRAARFVLCGRGWMDGGRAAMGD
jgi:hypothetical protein